MRRLELMGTVLLLLLILGLSASTALSNPPSQPPPPPGLQQAPKRPAPLKPPPPRTGFIPPPIDLSHLTGQRMPEIFRLEVLPSSFDWRTYNVVTSVKNQAACGSCYAFASIGNFESKMLIDGAYTLPDPDFSENNAKECNWYETSGPLPIGSCDGGNYDMLANLFSKKGTVLESCDPYVASDVSCNSTCPYQKTLLDWRIISGDAVPDTDLLKTYIQNYGPVYTSMYASFPGFDPTYDGSYTFYYPYEPIPNHAVLIVGWDDTLDHAGPGTGGWIVKNSWGTGWGGPCGYGTEGGYFTIAYGSASIGKWSSFIYDWQDYDTAGGIMYYDEGGMSNAWGCGPTTAWGLVKFIPSSNASVTRVEFWTLDATTDIDVYIYDNFDGSAPTTLLWSGLDNSFDEAGYHSVAVDPPLAVTAGNDVIAVVKFTNSSEVYPVVSDQYGPYETGRTYISCDGTSGSWEDLGADPWPNQEDIAIRLRTSSLEADFSAYPRVGVPPLTVDFTDLSTGNITDWLWNFEDDTITSTLQNPTHIYNSVGDYTVTLTVTGPGGSDAETKSDYIRVWSEMWNVYLPLILKNY